MKQPTHDRCRVCNDFLDIEYMVLREFEPYDVAYICDPCNAKLPKVDPRDWREDETVLTFPDGSQMKISQETGMLEDVDATNSLPQKDDRVSTEIESHAIRAAGYFALACVGAFVAVCFLLEGK